MVVVVAVVPAITGPVAPVGGLTSSVVSQPKCHSPSLPQWNRPIWEPTGT
jgi:hypothetical protein